jgi:hypothetical protein
MHSPDGYGAMYGGGMLNPMMGMNPMMMGGMGQMGGMGMMPYGGAVSGTTIIALLRKTYNAMRRLILLLDVIRDGTDREDRSYLRRYDQSAADNEKSMAKEARLDAESRRHQSTQDCRPS